MGYQINYKPVFLSSLMNILLYIMLAGLIITLGLTFTFENPIKQKTKKIIKIQNSCITGMSTMVETHDNSTGGHIKRTNDCGRVFSEYLKKQPGKFTGEEYEMMKSHSKEGAEIVSEVLSATEDENFKKIAVNVAHYHHGKWNGTLIRNLEKNLLTASQS